MVGAATASMAAMDVVVDSDAVGGVPVDELERVNLKKWLESYGLISEESQLQLAIGVARSVLPRSPVDCDQKQLWLVGSGAADIYNHVVKPLLIDTKIPCYTIGDVVADGGSEDLKKSLTDSWVWQSLVSGETHKPLKGICGDTRVVICEDRHNGIGVFESDSFAAICQSWFGQEDDPSWAIERRVQWMRVVKPAPYRVMSIRFSLKTMVKFAQMGYSRRRELVVSRIPTV